MNQLLGLSGRLAGGVFCYTDPSGRRLLSPAGELAVLLGVESEELHGDLRAVLGRSAPRAYEAFFASEGEDPPSIALPYRGKGEGRRWLRLRRSLDPDAEGRVLLFVSEETLLRDSLLRVAASESKEVENSARLQAAILTEQRHGITGLDYQTTTIPSTLVDGDFIEMSRLAEGSVDILLGDVMGKGMDAAIMGATIKLGFARALSLSLFGAAALPDPAAICAAVERAVGPRLLERQSFATLTYARLLEAESLLRYVDCGHTSILHLSSRSGEVWRIKGSNLPMGFLPRQDYRSHLLPLEEGDLLFFYTDGLSECVNRWGESFGEERVARLLRTYAELPMDELAGTILRLGFSYSAAGFGDDVSLICLRVGAGEAEARSGGRSYRAGAFTTIELEGLVAAFDADLGAWQPGLGEEPHSALLLAFHEAAANILAHGSPEAGGCDFAWRLRGERLWIDCRYTGPDYDWSKPATSPLADFADSGYGRLILENAMDSLVLGQGLGGRKRLLLCRSLRGEGTKGGSA